MIQLVDQVLVEWVPFLQSSFHIWCWLLRLVSLLMVPSFHLFKLDIKSFSQSGLIYRLASLGNVNGRSVTYWLNGLLFEILIFILASVSDVGAVAATITISFFKYDIKSSE